MADMVLWLANIYLAVAIAAVFYRGYGICARAIARKTAQNALEKMANIAYPLSRSPDLHTVAANIFSDNLVESKELDRFAEVAVASYIAEKDRTILELKRALNEQDVHIRILGYLLQRTMRDRAYLESIVAKIEIDGRRSMLGDALTKLFARHRLEGFALEFSNLIADKFEHRPKRANQYVDAELLSKTKK